jgi:phosphohistidine swiveling domain-containing protein
MNEEQYLKKINFKLFLKRDLSLLAVSCLLQGYAIKLPKSINFGFKNIAYIRNEDLTESFRTEKELKQYNQAIKKLLTGQKSHANHLLNKGLKINNKVVTILHEKINYRQLSDQQLNQVAKKLITLYTDLFTFTTIVPYQMGQSLTELPKGNINLNNKIEALRKISLYSEYEEKILGTLLKEVARRRQLKDHKLLFNLQKEEIFKIIKGKLDISPQNLTKRKKYLVLVTPKINLVITGPAVSQYYQKIIKKTVIQTNKKIISGQIAYPGKVVARARVIITKKELALFKKGEILVTISSNPELMPAIIKAKAIIADEGGSTCHAAVISRELKIPCIVGTKTATKNFKTGDKLEVDANLGTIKKID